MNTLLKKLRLVLENSMEENLLVASVLIRLAAVPAAQDEPDSIMLHNFFVDTQKEGAPLVLMQRVVEDIQEQEHAIANFRDAIKKRKDAYQKSQHSSRGPAADCGQNSVRTKRILDVLHSLEQSCRAQ